MFCGKFEGKRAELTKNIIYRHLNTFTTKKQMLNNRFIQLADDRVELRTMIDDACIRPYIYRKRIYTIRADE
ncbi:hypothetical protein PoB_002241500 [Plakobranchus ocellatus]|uniref:Uncharacterized protein n=1 Tax=Plakobranchus ocellatus TaxID=259542 RepID=A0AAV3ZLA9_9GAST|nr:hypothetical protein PoB_002241500 [Plakobranchus ocellatus]